LKREQLCCNKGLGCSVPRVRFDIVIQHAIRDQQRGGGEILSSIKLNAQAQQPAPQQQTAPRQGLRRAAWWATRFLLIPFKPAARYVRRFLVERIEADLKRIEADLEALRALFNNVQNKLDAVQIRQAKLEERLEDRAQDVDTRLGRALELTQLLHEKVDDIGLRSRGALPVDDTTLALRTYDGFVLVPRQDTQLLLMLLDAGPQGLEPGTRRVLLKLLAPGMTFVDVGAHVGLLTLAGARAVGPSGKVLAIEPVPLSFELLSRTLAINGLLHRVEVKRQAAGARRERCAFFVGSVLGHSSLIRGDALSAASTVEIEVEVSPLDDLVERRERVDVVKIDVEGAELAVLEGMTRVIADNPELAIIAEFGPSHLKASHTVPEKWFSAFHDRGFGAFVIDELSAECQPVNLAKLADVDSVNILFGRHDSSVLTRVLR
jgi:FkbM family methyltransferase